MRFAISFVFIAIPVISPSRGWLNNENKVALPILADIRTAGFVRIYSFLYFLDIHYFVELVFLTFRNKRWILNNIIHQNIKCNKFKPLSPYSILLLSDLSLCWKKLNKKQSLKVSWFLDLMIFICTKVIIMCDFCMNLARETHWKKQNYEKYLKSLLIPFTSVSNLIKC